MVATLTFQPSFFSAKSHPVLGLKVNWIHQFEIPAHWSSRDKCSKIQVRQNIISISYNGETFLTPNLNICILIIGLMTSMQEMSDADAFVHSSLKECWHKMRQMVTF